MLKFAEATGKTVDAAAAAARRELGISEDEGSMEILDLPKAGFLGLGARPARVKVSVELPDEEPKPCGSEQPAPRRESRKPRKGQSAPKYEHVPAVEYPEGSREQKVDAFLRGLMERMDIEADVIITKREGGGINVELAGPNMGAVIGRRGETLDAIQHLTNYALNRGSDKHLHISVDAENYRSKREDSLVHLAEKMAAKALKYKRSMALEPMNSYERHVIHTALQDYPGVTTSSIGTEPNRRVVVSCEGVPEQPQRGKGRRSGERRPRPERRESVPAAEESVSEAPASEPAPAEPKPAPAAPVFPEGYEPPAKNKPTSREWC